MDHPARTGLAQALATLAANRDPAAWALLVEVAGPAMTRIARRIAGDALGDDAVQEALLQIRDGAAGFTPPDADGDGHAWSWIMQVTRNAALQLLRRQRQQADRARRGHKEPLQPEAPGNDLERREQAGQIRRELAGLPEPTRSAIVLHCIEGFGYDQVAAELRMPVGTAKTRVHRGLGLLRQRLQRVGCVLSLTVLAAALQQLPASTAPVAANALLPLLAAAETSSLGAVGVSSSTTTIGIAMTIKIALATAAVLAVATVPFLPSADAPAPAPAPVAAAGPARPAAAAVNPAALRDRLDQRITAEFVDQPLVDVVAFLREMSGVTLNAMPPLADQEGITLKVAGMRLHDVMTFVSRLSNRELLIDAEDVVIGQSRPEAIDLADMPAGEAARLEARVTLDLQAASFRDTIAHIQRLSGVAVVVAPGLAAHPPAVTLTVNDLPLRRTLALVALMSGTTVTWRDGAVFFAGLPEAKPAKAVSATGRAATAPAAALTGRHPAAATDF